MESKLTHYADNYFEQEKIPGAAIAIVEQGEVMYEHVWGIAGEDKQRVTNQTPFALGSISKSFTGLAIAQLISEEKLSLDYYISDYLPWLQLNGAEDHITIRHLLTHTSGISSYDGLKVADQGIAEQIKLKQIVQRLSTISLTNNPGSEHQYSAANYLILGAILEEVTDKTFAEYMKHTIFSPLHMTHTAADKDSANRTGYRVGYQSWFGFPVQSTVPYDNSGAAYSSITSSAEDMTKFIQLFSGKSSPILNKYTEKLYKKESEVYYGYGLRHTKLDSGKDIIWHSGSTPDAHAEFFYLPEEDWGAVILTNKNHILEETSLPLLKEGIIDIMHGIEPERIPSYFPSTQLILCFIMAAILLWSIFLIIRRKVYQKKKPVLIGGFLSLICSSLLIPILIYSSQSPWHSISAFAPDLAFLIITIVGLLCLHGIICIVTYFNQPARKHKELGT
ncbi:serine hydrolase [Terribacillus sp. DMT04]|uniref:serine hydrolase domain-containing protein n=1 Tax=Terribacillus sp. DMT04 TaxID=2850441 RepID=UPI001C2C7DC2|nr:serine hydrolase domain-containing protein [Terribacillus sp. DMT04]QXE02332.1 beta-lactamase family protein [Terribacillus sp. DMT04]